ncbi:MAG: hypothetical protein CM1200mP28_12470 [Deltaproteobacteria bacterium]|nr:MAG: hypothetical protein CM1200mP28_12470 [Deltaproteobacteria bacterium]
MKTGKPFEPLDQAENILQASYAKHVDLFPISALEEETLNTVEALWQKFPGSASVSNTSAGRRKRSAGCIIN